MGYSVSLASTASQNESTASYRFNLTRDNGEAGSVDAYRYEIRHSGDWSLATGDFGGGAVGTFSWTLGQLTLSNFDLGFTVTNDSTVESNETFVIWIFEDEPNPYPNARVTPLDFNAPPFTLTLVNDDVGPPVFSSSDTLTAAENGTAVGTVAASGTGVTYSIVGGADQAQFAIDTNTGVLTFLANNDFEIPDDTGPNGVYNVTVRATDGTAQTTDQPIAVTLTNVNEAITVTNGAATNVAENTTTVLTGAKTDIDAGDTATWSISGGADASKFTIDSVTGVLSFVSAPNFESPTDSGANNVYDVQIQATDSGGLTDTQDIAVTVTDATELPIISSNGGGSFAVLNVSENYTGTLATVAAADGDGTAITYSVVAADDGSKFSIDSATGVLTFNSPFSPNYEAPQDVGADNTYEVTVRASAGGDNDDQKFFVIVGNVSEAGDPAPPPGGGGGGGNAGGGTTGNDNLNGTTGSDSRAGGDGNDTINGGDGDDFVDGDNGFDVLLGGAGNDFIRGLNDDDQVYGEDGADDVNGNLGQDFVDGGAGNDTVRGGQGDDTVWGGEGDDGHVNGNIGNDQVYGGVGSDTLFGGQNNDTLYGEDGNDRLSGDLGNDLLYGGAGADRFAFAAGGGADWVGDFSFNQGDRIQLATGTAYTLASVGGQAVIVLSDGSALGLAGVASTSFTADWIVFG